jgi:hypothetical protein
LTSPKNESRAVQLLFLTIITDIEPGTLLPILALYWEKGDIPTKGKLIRVWGIAEEKAGILVANLELLDGFLQEFQEQPIESRVDLHGERLSFDCLFCGIFSEIDVALAPAVEHHLATLGCPHCGLVSTTKGAYDV